MGKYLNSYEGDTETDNYVSRSLQTYVPVTTKTSSVFNHDDPLVQDSEIWSKCSVDGSEEDLYLPVQRTKTDFEEFPCNKNEKPCHNRKEQQENKHYPEQQEKHDENVEKLPTSHESFSLPKPSWRDQIHNEPKDSSRKRSLIHLKYPQLGNVNSKQVFRPLMSQTRKDQKFLSQKTQKAFSFKDQEALTSGFLRKLQEWRI